MNGTQLLHGLDLNHKSTLHQDVDAVAAIEVYAPIKSPAAAFGIPLSSRATSAHDRGIARRSIPTILAPSCDGLQLPRRSLPLTACSNPSLSSASFAPL